MPNFLTTLANEIIFDRNVSIVIFKEHAFFLIYAIKFIHKFICQSSDN